MRLHPHEFIRRFLLHVLPKGFHRIRHYGLLASANRAESVATARALLGADPPAVETRKQPDVTPDAPRVLPCPCPRCGARIPIALAAKPEPNFPRLRASALFGRRPPVCEASLVMPASKNLHNSGRTGGRPGAISGSSADAGSAPLSGRPIRTAIPF